MLEKLAREDSLKWMQRKTLIIVQKAVLLQRVSRPMNYLV